MSDNDPIIMFRPSSRGEKSAITLRKPHFPEHHLNSQTTRFNRGELREILAVYGRKVAAGEWRDYAIDMGRDKAVFSAFRRASEYPLIRIEKAPRLARRQGAYSIIAPTGQILKRGHSLRRVLGILEKSLRAVP